LACAKVHDLPKAGRIIQSIDPSADYVVDVDKITSLFTVGVNTDGFAA